MANPEPTLRSDSTKSASELWFDRFLTRWQDFNAAPAAQTAVFFFAGLALICGTTAFIGAVPTKVYGHDVFVSLEMGWRVINGQRPHVDFTSAWGPVWYLVSALGLTISSHSVNGVGYGNAIVALIVGSWSFFLSRNRLTASARVVLGLFLAALVAAPYPLGDSPFIPSHAMVYNRYGYALLSLILLEGLEPARSRNEEWVGGISTGAALSLTLFLKASYFLMGVVAIAFVSVLLNRLGRRRLIGILIGFSFVSICFLGYLHFDLAAMLQDLRMAGGARREALSAVAIAVKILGHASVLLGVVLFAFTTMLLFGTRVARWHGLKLPIIGIFLFAADIGLMSTNQQSDGFPLCAVFAILMVSEIMQDQQRLQTAEASAYRPLYAGALCLGALLFVPPFASDLTGLYYGAWLKQKTPAAGEVLPFTPGNLKPLLLYDGAAPRSNGRVFATYVNDGVALLARDSGPQETILSMDMTNPFPYALGRRPPHGGIVSPTYHYNIDDEHRPSYDQFFGDADIVMVPKHPAIDDYFYRDFIKAYAPGIKQRYDLAAETEWWRMFRRKQ